MQPKPTRLFRLSVSRLRPSQTLDKIRAFVIVKVMQFMCWFGYKVLLVGVCRTGKTYLLTLTGYELFNTVESLHANNYQSSIQLADIPSRRFAIDEAGRLNHDWVKSSAPTLRERSGIYAFQTIDAIARAGFNPIFDQQRVLLVHLA